MQRGIYSACSAMLVQTTYLDVIANNLANADSAGFRKRIAVSQSFPDMLMDRIEKVSEDGETKLMTTPPFVMNFKGKVPIGTLSFANVMSTTYMPEGKGPYVVTDNPLDAAIDGDGFFALQDDEGNIRYTRQGNFQKSSDGNIVTQSGLRLMSGGAPVNIGEATDFRFTENGNIMSNGELVGAVDIVTFENPSYLQQVGSTTLLASTPAAGVPTPRENIIIRPGVLEKSNVNVVEEMTRMIEVQRAYEAASKALMTDDDTAGKMLSTYSK